MKKKLYITRTVKLIALTLLVFLSALILQDWVVRRIDHNTLRMDAFYAEKKGTLDAVLVGASDVYAGYSAPYAYEKYGYTSFPFATQASPSNIVLPQIKEVIKYQNPKMIVVEINAFLYPDNKQPAEVNCHLFADNIPRDQIWRDYIEKEVSEDTRIEYYIPLLKFHGSWNEYPWKLKYLSADIKLRNRGYALLRGYKTVSNIFTANEKIANSKFENDDSTKPLGPIGERCLRETLEYLKENDIHNVVFTRFPHIVRQRDYARFKRGNRAGEIIESYGYDFVNIERYALRDGFDLEHDWYNWDHLNIFGAEKCTDYIADLLLNKYGLEPSEQTAQQKENWQKSVECYHKVYNYSESLIERGVFGSKDAELRSTVEEDDETLRLIDEFAEKYPDYGKYAKK